MRVLYNQSPKVQFRRYKNVLIEHFMENSIAIKDWDN